MYEALLLLILGLVLIAIWRLRRKHASEQVISRSAGPNLASGKVGHDRPHSEVSPAPRVIASHVKPGSDGPILAPGTKSQVRPHPEKPDRARASESQGAPHARALPEKRARMWAQAPFGPPPVLAQNQRSSDRVLLTIPVQVEGTDGNGKTFNERTFTLVINRQGGSINLRTSPRVGDRITITNLQNHQLGPFKVCVAPKSPRGSVAEWGVQSLELNPDFWGVRFPEREDLGSVQDYVSAVIECDVCRSREMVELREDQFRSMAERGVLARDCQKCGIGTEWKFGVFEGNMEVTLLPNNEPNPSTSSVPLGGEKRRDKRLIVKLPITIKHKDGRVERSVTENTSKFGACFASNSGLEVGEIVFLTYESRPEGGPEERPARVMWRRGGRNEGVSLFGVLLEQDRSNAA